MIQAIRETHQELELVFKMWLEEGSRMDDCIIGENCQIGSESILNENVVVGPNCSIGNLVKIQPGTRI